MFTCSELNSDKCNSPRPWFILVLLFGCLLTDCDALWCVWGADFAALCRILQKENPPSNQTAVELKLTRADLEEIINKRRQPTMAEIEWLLAHGRDYKHKLDLTTGEEQELRAMAAQIQAEARLPAGTRQATNDDFVAKTLGTYRTAYGDLSKADIARLETIRVEAERAIAACKDHKKERCRCWVGAREALFELRGAGDKSPLGISALALWNTIEALARNRNLEPPAPPAPALSPQAQAEILGSPVPNPYNWRFWKSPTYHENIR